MSISGNGEREEKNGNNTHDFFLWRLSLLLLLCTITAGICLRKLSEINTPHILNMRAPPRSAVLRSWFDVVFC